MRKWPFAESVPSGENFMNCPVSSEKMEQTVGRLSGAAFTTAASAAEMTVTTNV